MPLQLVLRIQPRRCLVELEVARAIHLAVDPLAAEGVSGWELQDPLAMLDARGPLAAVYHLCALGDELSLA